MINMQEIMDSVRAELEKVSTREYPKEQQVIKDKLGQDLYEVLKSCRAILAGGAVTSLFTGKDINDFDLYFRDKEGVSRVITEMYSKSDLFDISWGDLRPVHATSRSLLCTNGQEENIQLILYKLFDGVADIFKSFDFTINMGAYDFEKEQFIFHEDFFKHNSQRFLSFNENTDYPLISAMRVQKYTERGYSTSKAQMLKILFTVASKEFDSWDKVVDECGGMYGLEPSEIFPTEEEFSLEKVIQSFDKVFISGKIKTVEVPEFETAIKKFKGVITDNLYNFITSPEYSRWEDYDENKVYESASEALKEE